MRQCRKRKPFLLGGNGISEGKASPRRKEGGRKSDECERKKGGMEIIFRKTEDSFTYLRKGGKRKEGEQGVEPEVATRRKWISGKKGRSIPIPRGGRNKKGVALSEKKTVSF